ncbi:MAG: single-stranded DNA-binding protein [Bacteroidetes bacterium CG02_land_8_20_14_3_00_31_25]|nr:single-stranded DNA-binding protein [Bacteroidota bacterium]PIV58165.1 MAG: single-stranded DNA-binding protein [Bacteroidetes bacterium CG02_land_8_20_14_3_00_31_25]PIX33139.1 MAG: single-stranded DNA-binding protein [Bacteroidetes bacterium CG_4_8_14_3_um_filter_31_14]PIY06365.1 MAG: single-stranded DNA-binding protein [Bacteroidetes bacterium CG_4_10_14_3_um_filter_31_20]
MSVNKAILIGNVGKDPDVRHLDNDVTVARFTLATSESYKKSNGEVVKTTEWHNIVLWRGLAQVAEKYVKKGSQIYIEGKIRTRSYDDKDGNKKYFTEIQGDNLNLLGKKESSDSTQVAPTNEVGTNNQIDINQGTPTDDLPF